MPDPSPPHDDIPEARAVLDHWFGDALTTPGGWPAESRGAIWFGGGADIDAEIRTRFGPLVEQAIAGGLVAWEHTPPARLALVLLLDQMTRNVFRRQVSAFAGDARAQQLTLDALARGWDQRLPLAGRVFLYLPLTHAESLPLQQRCVACFEALVRDCAPAHRAEIEDHLRYAVLHHDIVAAHGRFPHRNAVLGRTDTAREQEFLRDGPRFGQ